MENFARDIGNMLEHKLILYRQLNAILKEEREFIVNIDVDSLWKSAELKKKTVEKVQKLKEKIFVYIETWTNINKIDLGSFSISYIIRNIPLPKDLKIKIRKIKLAVDNEKNELARAASENKKFVQEYLGVIDDIMSVAVDNSRQPQYNFSGTRKGTKNSNCLIHAQV